MSRKKLQHGLQWIMRV